MTSKRPLLTRAELRELRGGRGWFWPPVLATWLALTLVIGGLVWSSRALSGLGLHLAWAGSFVAIGWLQYVLVQGLHEAVHQKFGAQGPASLLAALATAWPVGMTRTYRDVHLDHHRHPGDPERDPDYVMYGGFPRSRSALLGTILFYFSGLPAIIQRVRQGRFGAGSGARAGQSRPSPEASYMVLTQAALLGIFTQLMGMQYYFLFWLLPITTIVKGLGFLRILAEHSDPNHSIVFRSFATGIVRRNLLGPFGFAHHAEHHDYMSIAYPGLAAISRRRREVEGWQRGHHLMGEYQSYAGSQLGLVARWLFVEFPAEHPSGSEA